MPDSSMRAVFYTPEMIECKRLYAAGRFTEAANIAQAACERYKRKGDFDGAADFAYEAYFALTKRDLKEAFGRHRPINRSCISLEAQEWEDKAVNLLYHNDTAKGSVRKEHARIGTPSKTESIEEIIARLEGKLDAVGRLETRIIHHQEIMATNQKQLINDLDLSVTPNLIKHMYTKLKERGLME